MNFLPHKERLQDPHVSVLLDDNCNPPFRPGSRISGVATLQCPSQRQLQGGEAIFFGRAVTNCTRIGSMGTSYFRRANFSTNETLRYHDDACLFRQKQSFGQQCAIQPDQPYAWNFEFVFPHSASLIGPSPYHPTEIYASERHLLPPSFARYFNENHYATVEYNVQAVFQFSDNPQPLTVQLPPLDFLPHPGLPDSSTLIEYVRPAERFSRSRLTQERKSFRHSLGEKISSSRSSIPSVDLIIKTSLNTNVKQSSPLPIHSCVEIGFHPAQPISIQSINIRIKSLKLYQVTMFRAREIQGTGGMPEYQEIGEHTIALNAIPNQVSVQAQTRPSKNGNTILFPASFEARIPHDVPPCFRTFNINQSHQLKLTLEAEVAGKTFEHKIIVERLNIFPS